MVKKLTLTTHKTKRDMMIDNFTEFFNYLDDDFFIDLYENDYSKLEQMCVYLTLDQQIKRENERKRAENLAD